MVDELEQWDAEAWAQRSSERQKRLDEMLAAGWLSRQPEGLATIEEVADFIRLGYWAQMRDGGKLPLAPHRGAGHAGRAGDRACRRGRDP